MENPITMDDLGGTILLGNTQIVDFRVSSWTHLHFRGCFPPKSPSYYCIRPEEKPPRDGLKKVILRGQIWIIYGAMLTRECRNEQDSILMYLKSEYYSYMWLYIHIRIMYIYMYTNFVFTQFFKQSCLTFETHEIVVSCNHRIIFFSYGDQLLEGCWRWSSWEVSQWWPLPAWSRAFWGAEKHRDRLSHLPRELLERRGDEWDEEMTWNNQILKNNFAVLIHESIMQSYLWQSLSR